MVWDERLRFGVWALGARVQGSCGLREEGLGLTCFEVKGSVSEPWPWGIS